MILNATLIRYCTSLFVFVVSALLSCSIAQAQNLVPNGDFEQYNTCPIQLTGGSTTDGIAFSPGYTNFPTVKNWVRPLQNSTPDYFNVCAPPFSSASSSGNISVPRNLFGYQQPHSGKGYAGVYTFHSQTPVPPNDYREPLTVKLSQPMMKDSQYCVSFFISTTVIVPGGPFVSFNFIAVNEFGAHFSDTQPYSSSTTIQSLSLPYHVSNDTNRLLTDTGKWSEIQGIYTAAGGEQWMTLGCFNHSPMPAYRMIPGYPFSSTKGWFGYAYLDDVSVVQVKHYTYIHDTVFCDAGLVDYTAVSSAPGGPFLWSTGESSRSIHITRPGTYWCQVTGDCEVYTDTFHMNVTPAAAPKVHDTDICQYTTAPVLYVAGSGLHWYSSLADTSGSTTQPAINTAQPGTYTLYVNTIENGCRSEKAAIHITITPVPVGHSAQDITRCTGAPDTLKMGTKPQPGVTYTWSTGATTYSINPAAAGQYIRTGYNDCGTVADTFRISEIVCEDCIHVPSAFTPNADGRNDGFKVLIRCPVKEFYMRIFDRWGESVYVSYDPYGYWDGRKNGVNAPTGVYMYMISCHHAATGEEIFLKGDLTLLR